MKTNFYKSTMNDLVITKIIQEENSEYRHIWQRLSSSTDYHYIGIILETTKKGFYYRDNFGVKIYVTWNKLQECNFDE